MHRITQDAKAALMISNNYNKTGDLDIFWISPLTPETGVQVPVGLPKRNQLLTIIF